MKILIGIVLLLSNVACANSVPNWFLNPPSETGMYFGIGEGRDAKQSEQAAIENVLGQLRTRVSSSFEHNQRQLNDMFQEEVNLNLNSSVEEIPISDYSVVERVHEAGTTYTLLKISKTSIVRTIRSEINANHDQLIGRMQEKGRKNSELEWWFDEREHLSSLIAANKRYVSILVLLEERVNDEKSQLSTLMNDVDSSRRALCVYVDKDQEAQLYTLFRDIIMAADLPADKTSCPYQLITDKKNKNKHLFGQYSTSMKITINVEYNGRIIGSTELVTTGVSPSGYDEANETAIEQMKEKLGTEPKQFADSLFGT